ncbi:MAG: CAP domain-containing protein [Spirochaetaceae bacterium]|nr:MAG: CAP domain-containing protein [Spirochaetaceae bacterium]
MMMQSHKQVSFLIHRKAVAVAAAVALIFVATAVDAQSAWNADRYRSVDRATFVRLPEANELIDFDRIDYPLLHAAIFYLTNAEREARGLSPLTHQTSLESAARVHSEDMRDRNFFSHTSPVPGRRTVRDRTDASGFSGSGVGENIARTFGITYEAGRSVFSPLQNDGYFSYTYRGDPIPPHTYLSAAEVVVEQWMKSPGHRENILRREYRYLGTGAAYFADRSFFGIPSFFYTQVFGL